MPITWYSLSVNLNSNPTLAGFSGVVGESVDGGTVVEGDTVVEGGTVVEAQIFRTILLSAQPRQHRELEEALPPDAVPPNAPPV